MSASLRVPALLLMAVLLAWGATYLVLADGGAPIHAELGVSMAEPELEAWQLTNQSGVVCSHVDPCPARLEGPCQWEGVVWLSSAGNPAFLRDVSMTAWASGWSGEGSKSTPFEGNGTVSREEGPWLRSMAQHVVVAVDVPCGADWLRVSINTAARTLGGKAWQGSQTVELALTSA